MRHPRKVCTIIVGFLSMCLLLSGCATTPKKDFEPRVRIDPGIALPQKVTLAIAGFQDQRPFLDPEKPKSYRYIALSAPGFDVRSSVDWSNPKFDKGFMAMWDSTEKKTSDLIQESMIEVFNDSGFEAVPVGQDTKDMQEILTESRSKGCSLLLTGNIKHFQLAHHSGAIGGLYYLRQTIELETELIQVDDGARLMEKTFDFDHEEVDAGHVKYGNDTIYPERILLNTTFPRILEKMIHEIKDVILATSAPL